MLFLPPFLPHFPPLVYRLDKAVTPLLGTPYESQLASKTAHMRQILQKAAQLILREDSNPVQEESVFVVVWCGVDHNLWELWLGFRTWHTIVYTQSYLIYHSSVWFTSML